MSQFNYVTKFWQTIQRKRHALFYNMYKTDASISQFVINYNILIQ